MGASIEAAAARLIHASGHPMAMSETNDRFHRSAMRAAGPVFFVAFGLLLLLVLTILLVFTAPPSLLAWGLGIAGLGSLALGVVLARVDSATERRELA